MMSKWLANSSLTYIVVATKKDKIPRAKLKERLADITSTLELDNDTLLIPFSSETKDGREEIMNCIATLLEDKVN